MLALTELVMPVGQPRALPDRRPLGRDEARLVLADDEVHVRVRSERELARRHARAHPLAKDGEKDGALARNWNAVF